MAIIISKHMHRKRSTYVSLYCGATLHGTTTTCTHNHDDDATTTTTQHQQHILAIAGRLVVGRLRKSFVGELQCLQDLH